MSSQHVPRPSSQDILRYRYHHGTNLGSIFVLERWLHGSMYDAGSAGDSELDAVIACVLSHLIFGAIKLTMIPLQLDQTPRP